MRAVLSPRPSGGANVLWVTEASLPVVVQQIARVRRVGGIPGGGTDAGLDDARGAIAHANGNPGRRQPLGQIVLRDLWVRHGLEWRVVSDVRHVVRRPGICSRAAGPLHLMG